LNQLIEKILEEIRNQGPISFARFMEWALYCPVYGYYEKEEDTLGRHGDYYTSVSVGPLFGELLARQFAAWLEELRGPVCLVEAGAHRGHLARDILCWLRSQRPALFQAIQYCIVEPSAKRQEWQRSILAEFKPQIRWVKSLAACSQSINDRASEDSERGVHGIIFSNELLDSMPVHRFGWDAAGGAWFEWGVTFENAHLSWTKLPGSAGGAPADSDHDRSSGEKPALPGRTAPPDLPPELLRSLPDGFTIEVCPAASQWWAQAARVLEAGKLLAMDYGLTADEWLTPERAVGTVRGYRQHRLSSDILADPGGQDITAHVNFTTIRQVGESEGLRTDELVTQEQFLTRIAAPVLRDQSSFWTPERVRQFQTLTHPNHLGRAFRVLVQAR
jgi:SAM-dependent MidA family methyltransferase